jgi:hypothetical protein
MAKANRSDLDDWNVDEQRQRQRALQLELVEKLKRRQDAGETLLSQQEIDWFKGRPVTDEEMNELKEHIEMTNNNTQTKTTWWTETKLWIVSSIFFITFLTLGWFYPMIALAICLIALGAVFLYVLVWLGTLLLKEILGLDDE